MALSNGENLSIAKCIEPGQPARTAQADQGQYILQMHGVPFVWSVMTKRHVEDIPHKSCSLVTCQNFSHSY